MMSSILSNIRFTCISCSKYLGALPGCYSKMLFIMTPLQLSRFFIARRITLYYFIVSISRIRPMITFDNRRRIFHTWFSMTLATLFIMYCVSFHCIVVSPIYIRWFILRPSLQLRFHLIYYLISIQLPHMNISASHHYWRWVSHTQISGHISSPD